MAAIALKKPASPAFARTRPTLVPDDGVMDPRAAAAVLAAAGVDPKGALAGVATDPIDLPDGRGGPARGGALIDQPNQPAPIVEGGEDGGDGGGGFDVLKMLSGMGKAAGKGAPDASAALETANAGDNSSSGGLLDRIKSLFLGGAAKPSVAAAQVTANPNAGAFAGPIDNPPIGLPTDAPMIPTPRPALPGDPPEPRMVAANDSALMNPKIDPSQISAATPALPAMEKDRTILDKLRDNPMAAALIFGGLGTMGAASRPGATPLGALGVGLGGGLKSAFEMEGTQRDMERADRKAQRDDDRDASENALRLKQGAFYDARTATEPEKAAAGTTRAGAALTGAKARQTSADASMVRADAYSKKANDPKGGAGASVFQQKQQAWLAVPGHENDLQGALDYAAGHKNMSGADKYLAARRLATSQMNGMVAAPDDAQGFLENTTADIMRSMDANDASHGNGSPGSKGNSGGGALGGGKGGQGGGGALGGAATVHSAADVQKLSKGALYINPADGKTYRKK